MNHRTYPRVTYMVYCFTKKLIRHHINKKILFWLEKLGIFRGGNLDKPMVFARVKLHVSSPKKSKKFNKI